MQDPNGKSKRPMDDDSKDAFERTEKAAERVDEWPPPIEDDVDDESGGKSDDD